MAKAGRKSRIADPVFAQAVAELYAAGNTHADIADELHADKSSVSTWVRNPLVQMRAHRIILDRTMRITRRIDSTIEGRLNNVEKWDLDDLLKVRKELIRSLPSTDKETDTAGATAELSEAMDQNPELAAQLRAIVEKAPADAKE